MKFAVIRAKLFNWYVMHADRFVENAISRRLRLTYGFYTLILAMFMLLVYPVLNIDRHLTDFFFDADQHHFLLKHNFFLERVMHDDWKWLMVVIALGSLITSLVANRFSRLRAYKRSFLWAFVGMLLSTSAVAVFKHYDQHGCPWDLAIYGGDLPLLGLFESLPKGVSPGHCFPAGHASGGFSLMSFYFAFMHSQPDLARNLLQIGVVMGVLMGMVQVMRGAHFLSHVLWSGWLVWAVLLMLYWIWPPYQNASATTI